jgi:hypothetical protein
VSKREVVPIPDDGSWSVIEPPDWVVMDGFTSKEDAEHFADGMLLGDHNLCDRCGHVSTEPFARCSTCGRLNL